MTTRRSLIGQAALAGATLALAGPGSSRAERRSGPVVAELFTSQSCSSCPPADRVLAGLAADPAVIALAWHVDYWNHLSWRDTLSSPEATSRQRAYAQRIPGGVYTPELVVNGRVGMVGSQAATVAAHLEAGRGEILPVGVALAGGSLTVGLPAGAGAGTVWLAAYAHPVTQAIARGENGGATITYHHAVRRFDPVGAWQGRAEALQVALPGAEADADMPVKGYAVLVQDGTGPILAAGRLDLQAAG